MGFWRIIFTIILPPLGVLLGKGVGGAFLINILLTLLGYFPGSSTPSGCKPKTNPSLKKPATAGFFTHDFCHFFPPFSRFNPTAKPLTI